MQRNQFPTDFVFGAATAAYQIEGAVDVDGRGPSIWDTFAQTPGAIVGGHTGEIADDHYHRVDEDVAMMSRLGLEAYRFSISWPRIQPDGTGPALTAGIDFYRRLVERLLAAGITPWATLYHWDLPQSLEERGGWLERDTALRFADYATAVADGLGDLVSHWITLNEPWCSAFLGYGSGVHAPGRALGGQALHAAHHLLLGHGLAVPRLRAGRPDATVGVTVNLYPVDPASSEPADLDAARRIDGLSNRIFLDPLLLGSYPEDVLLDAGGKDWFDQHAGPEDLATISVPVDFLGVNYYSRHTVSATAPANRVSEPAGATYPGSAEVRLVRTGRDVTEMGWEIDPHGLVEVLSMAHDRAKDLPLVVTENGSAFHDVVAADGSVDDPGRTRYLIDHVSACHDAIAAGIPLTGYFVWSLMDNFEWSFGYTRRFGIVHVDYDTQVRTPKTSARWYQEFLSS